MVVGEEGEENTPVRVPEFIILLGNFICQQMESLNGLV